jgi:predicted GH43/DUF377 family glycosyl hydrolase
MKRLLLSLLLGSILFYGCSNNSINSPENNTKSLGKVSINIDKVNAPADVSVVIATLTKANSDTLTGYMNLSTDTTANISFQNIVVGTWNLVVLAENASGTVLYKGESSVEVTEGTTTNIALTLNQVQNGTGNVSITVTWGVTQPYFVDYSANPVYTGSDNPSGQNYISEAKILYENGIYKMWYNAGYNSAGGKTWYAESSDGISWTNKYATPAIAPTSGSWDNLFTAPGAVIKDNGIYKMYYNGGSTGYGTYSIGLATSTDGINWQKNSTPVFFHDSSSQYYIGVHSVIKINNVYFMYYDARPINSYGICKIYLATSQDGINFSRYSSNPILTNTLSWEGVGINYPSVIYDGGQYIMLYGNSVEDAIGVAYSADGIHWTKKYNHPVLSISNTKLVTTQTGYPFFMKVNNEYRCYYTVSNYSGTLGISMARTNSIQ